LINFRRNKKSTGAEVSKVRPYSAMILGSCVTRDVFRLFGENVTISDYFARTSIVSLVSNPYQFSEGDIDLESDFQKRMVVRDMNKSFWERARTPDYDLLLVDFIDERTNLLRFDGSIICKSPELVTSGYLEKHGSEYEEISRLKYGVDQWSRDCDVFVGKIAPIIPPTRIVVIKAFWASKYLNDEGKVVPFDEGTKFDQSFIKGFNDLLSKYYKIFIKKNRGVNVIELPPPIADVNHIWGLSPFHYSDVWYQKCREELDRIAYKL
jgi:hypothetical protein